MKRILKKFRLKRKRKSTVVGRKRRRFWQNSLYQRIFIAAVLFILLSIIVTQGQTVNRPDIVEGEIAQRDIIAPFKFPVNKDAATLRKEKNKAAERVLPLFNENESAREIAADDIHSFYNIISQLSTAYKETTSRDRPRFVEDLKMGLSAPSILLLLETDDHAYLEGKTSEVMAEIYREGVLDYDVLVEKQLGQTIFLREIGEDEEFVVSVNSIMDIRAASDKGYEIASKLPNVSDEEKIAIAEIVATKIRPNILYDEAETDRRKNEARDAVDPILRWVEANEKIVESHTRITAEQVAMIDALYSGSTSINLMYTLGGRALLVFAVLTILGVFLYRNRPDHFAKPSTWLLLAIVIFSASLINRFVAVFLSNSAPWTLYLFGCALGAMMITLLIDIATGYAVVVILAVLAGIAAGLEMRPMVLALVGGIWGTYLISRLRQRSDFYWVALGLVLATVVVAVGMALVDMTSAEMVLRDILWGSALAVASVFVVAVALPLFENMFNITTDIKLLELADLNQPLLRRLIIEAPGTYHHSIIVGSLAEVAARSIGENTLAARVAAYYHDIGKLRSPGYFAENAGMDAHRHDRLSPQMSTLIISSHTKLGIELARENRLPDLILNPIAEHHGTTMISFFYQEALKTDEHNVLDKDDFRYPGPRPRTKISAIIMLADALESASRSLEDPSPNNIRNLVEHIVEARIQDRQFDDCDITLKEIFILQESLIKGLGSVFHYRPAYPGVSKELDPPVLSITDQEIKRN